VFFSGQSQNFHAPFANSNFAPGALVNAFFAGLFSYDGWDVLNFGAEEVDNPRFTMRFAIIVGMSCVTALYAAINISYFVVLDVATIKGSTAVAMACVGLLLPSSCFLNKLHVFLSQTFAQHSMGNLQHLMPFLINIVMIGALNGSIFTASRSLPNANAIH
jgi:amino acid transporter